MDQYLIKKSYLNDIGNAIKDKTTPSFSGRPEAFAEAILNIPMNHVLYEVKGNNLNLFLSDMTFTSVSFSEIGTYYPDGVDGYNQVTIPSFSESLTFNDFLAGEKNNNYYITTNIIKQDKFRYLNGDYLYFTNLTEIPSNGFHDIKFKNIIFEKNITINRDAFAYAETINISAPYCTFNNTATGVFYQCSNLISIPTIKLPTNSNNSYIIPSSTFCSLNNLKTINFEIDLNKQINIYFDAFRNCYELKNINGLNWNKINYIDGYAFYGCSDLFSLPLFLPECSFIGPGAFQNTNLSTITIGSNRVVPFFSDIFTNTQITSSTGSIYVPASLYDTYRTADGWSLYATQIQTITN